MSTTICIAKISKMGDNLIVIIPTRLRSKFPKDSMVRITKIKKGDILNEVNLI